MDKIPSFSPPCYCAHIQNKYLRVASKFQEYTHPFRRCDPCSPTIGVNHLCSLKGTHALDSYFASKIKALPDSNEELATHTQDLTYTMDEVIDSIDITTTHDDYDQIPLPSMFNSFLLSTECDGIQNATMFAKYYHEWKAYEQLKKENEVRSLLSRDDYILQEEEQRETLTLRDSKTGTCIEATIENYVYSTHFKNKHTGQSYKFNLSYLARKCIAKGVTYIKTKFAKIDFRTPWGSALIFESGGMIETGAKKRETSKKLLDHILNFLRYECGYKNIAISKRICQNVVMTGKTSHNICLNLLSSKYAFVTYYPDIFAGAMIRIEDLDKYYQMTSNDTFDDHEDDDDADFEVNPDEEVARNENPIDEEECDDIQIDDEDEEEDEEEEDDDDIDESIIKNTSDAFFYDYLKSTSGGGGDSTNKKNNATILLFEQGALISVGNKSRKKAKEALTKIHPILESCRDTPENLIQEKILASLSSSSNSTPSSSSLSPLTTRTNKRKNATNAKEGKKNTKKTKK